jgi:hypothetical protein
VSRTKQFLEMVAATAGCVSVSQYLGLLERDRKRDEDYEIEMAWRDAETRKFWQSIDDGSYFNEGGE